MNTFSDPNKIIEQLSLSGVNMVADFGAGNGAYSLTLARAQKTNPLFHVYAVDVLQDMLGRITTLASQESLSSVNVIWGDIEELKGSRLRDESTDLVILANTLFQLEHKGSALKEAYRVLKNGGQLLVIDWLESFGNIGPAEDAIIGADMAHELVEAHGFLVEKDIDAGEHHYGFISRKI